MTVVHTGEYVPHLAEPLDPDAVEWLGVAWDARIRDGVSITVSEWVLPTELEEQDTRTDEKSGDHQHVNKVLVSTTAVHGQTLMVTNRVTLSDGSLLDRSFYLPVAHI